MITAEGKAVCKHSSVTFSTPLVLTVVLVLLSERFHHSNLYQASAPAGQIAQGGKRGKTEISGFVEYLATLAPESGLFFGFTCVQGNVSHVSTLLCLLLSTEWAVGLGHGTLVQSWFCFYQFWAGGRQLCGRAASYMSGGPDLRPTRLNPEGWS